MANLWPNFWCLELILQGTRRPHHLALYCPPCIDSFIYPSIRIDPSMYPMIYPCMCASSSIHPYLLIHLYIICPSIYRVFLCPSTHACIHLSIHPCMYSAIYLSIHVYPCSQLASGTESSWPKASRYHCIPYVMGGGWELFIHIRLVTATAEHIVTILTLPVQNPTFQVKQDR